MSLLKKIRLDQLPGINISVSGLVSFSVLEAPDGHTEPYQVPGYIDIYTFLRARYGLDKYEHSAQIDKLNRKLIVRSGPRRSFTLTYV